MKKYIFTNETIEVTGGRKLHRICALIDIEIGEGVCAGDLGGFIEEESNLSQDGNAWVSDRAFVFDKAEVFGDAWVSGKAKIYNHAKVFGDALVSDNAVVTNDARVFGSAKASGNGKIIGQAQICGNAHIYGNAKVSGGALVCDDARVFGDAMVSGEALVCDDALVFGSAVVSGKRVVEGTARVSCDSEAKTTERHDSVERINQNDSSSKSKDYNETRPPYRSMTEDRRSGDIKNSVGTTVNKAPALAAWKTSVGATVGGIILNVVFLNLLALFISSPPFEVSGGNLIILILVPIIILLIHLYYALSVYPSLFSETPKLRDPGAISFFNGLFGYIVFSCLWNEGLTKKKIGISNIIFAFVLVLIFGLPFLARFCT